MGLSLSNPDKRRLLGTILGKNFHGLYKLFCSLLFKIYNEIHVNITRGLEYNITYGTEKLRPVRIANFSKAEELGAEVWYAA